MMTDALPARSCWPPSPAVLPLRRGRVPRQPGGPSPTSRGACAAGGPRRHGPSWRCARVAAVRGAARRWRGASPAAVAPPVTATLLARRRAAGAQLGRHAGRPRPARRRPASRPLARAPAPTCSSCSWRRMARSATTGPTWRRPCAARSRRSPPTSPPPDRRVVSAFVESPTFGGSSWLAHISLLTGVEVRDEDTNAALMAQPRDTLVTTFSRGGYRTVALMPGLRHPWPEGAFYGFDDIYDTRTGSTTAAPPFGWWVVPDQFALARFDVLEMRRRRARAPLFVFFPTISTHAPFASDRAVSARLAAPADRRPLRASPTCTAPCAATPDYLDWRRATPTRWRTPTRSIGGYLRAAPGPRFRDGRASAITSRRPRWPARAPPGTCRCTSSPAGRPCSTGSGRAASPTA